MPSSISSSNDRLPAGPHGRQWLLVVLLAALLLGGVELAWRSAGHAPSVVDDNNLWSAQLDEAGEPKRLVVLGMSRIQLGFATDVFRERYRGRNRGRNRGRGWDVAHLAVEGRPPAMTLKRLADDESFAGVVLVSVNPASMHNADAEGTASNWGWFGQRPFVEYYENTWHYRQTSPQNGDAAWWTVPRWDKRIVRRVATAIQDRVTLIHPNLSLRTLVGGAIEGAWPRPYYVDTQPDRSRIAHYAMADMSKRLAFMHGVAIDGLGQPAPTPDKWLGDAGQLAAWARTIEARGGTVFFVHMPESPIGNITVEQFPKEQYWDRFAAIETGGVKVKALHFQDEPTLRYKDVANRVPFHCPDYTHLDYADAVIFTGRLLDVLERRGWLAAVEK